MMLTNTGKHMCDSGFGERGRVWQRNKLDYPTLASIENEPQVTFDKPEKDTDSEELYPTVNVFHHLTESLTIDEVCESFNALECKDWDGDKAYGISEVQQEWLENHGFSFGDTWNSYNGECNLSQTLQGANMYLHETAPEFNDYVLLQLHQGADVRGGYTDAKLFKVDSDSGYFDTNPNIYGEIDGVQVDTGYNGWSLTNDSGEPVPVTVNSKIELYL